MSQLVDMVNRLRETLTIMSAGALADEHELHEINSWYREACLTVNERLSRCQQLLHRGCRSEAIRQAKMPPPVLTLLEHLNCPERVAWSELMGELGLKTPPPLLNIAGDELRDAIHREAEIENLLRRLRRQALEQRPLNERIHTLRELLEAEPDNPYWAQDLALHERSRCEQIIDEGNRAFQRKDVKTLDQLVAELKSPHWRTPPQKALVMSTESARNRLSQWDMRKHLEKLANKLVAAANLGDELTARTIREQWELHLEQVALPANDPLFHRVDPIFQWLDELKKQQADDDRRRQAIVALDTALLQNRSTEEIDRHWKACQANRVDVPQELQLRYKQRRTALANKERLRRMAWITAGTSVATLLLVLFGALWWSSAVASDRRDRLAALAELIEQRQYDQAQQFLTESHARDALLFDTPEGQRAKASAETAISEEHRRRERFARSLETLANESGHPAERALAEAEALARGGGERAEVARALEDYRRRRQAMRRDRDRAALAELDRLIDRTVALGGSREAVEPRLAELNNIEERLGAWQSQRGELGTQGVQRIDRLDRQVSATRGILRNEAAELALLEEITQAVGRPNLYRAALDKYRQTRPDGARASAFETVGGESNLWSELEAIANLIDEINRSDLSPGRASGLASRLRDVVQRRVHPHHETLEQRLALLTRVGNRKNAEGTISSQRLETFFSNPFMSKLHCVTLKSGERYYFLEEPSLQAASGAVQLRHVINQTGQTATTRVAEEQIDSVGRAPQAALSEELLAVLKPLHEALADDSDKAADLAWETTFMKMLETALAAQDVDPLLRAIIVRGICSYGAQGSEPFRQRVQSLQEAFQEAGLDNNYLWLNPSSEEGQKLRESAQELLRLAATLDRSVSPMAVAYQPLDMGVTWAGWLDRSRDGWTMRTREPLNGSGRLRVLLPDPNDPDNAQWHAVGRVTNGVATLNGVTAVSGLAGRPVYLTDG